MAGRIRGEDVAAVRERSPIEAVVGEHLQLRSAGGAELKGLCPFHDEKTPSFHVSPQRGVYHCFGCGEGGDVITFLEKIEQLSFSDAVERLAGRAGVQLRYEGGGAAPSRQMGHRARLLAAHQAALDFFRAALAGEEGRIARDFLAGRGFDEAAGEAFSVGYAPAGWDHLLGQLTGRGFTAEELLSGGLVRRSSRGSLIDAFRGRLVWPIRDISGDVIGFNARKLRDDDPLAKYVNTADTPLFKKSAVLYGVDRAKREIARRHQAVVVEGVFDVMACHLAGVPTAVATCGTAFGVEHIKVLRRLLMDQDEFRGEVIFTFDGDAAGQQAALRAFADDQRFVAQTFVAVQPDGLDPCELRQQRGDAAVRDLVASRVPLFEFAIRGVLDRHRLDTEEGRLAALDAAAPIVGRIRDEGLRKRYAVNLDRWLGFLDESFVLARVAHAAGRPSARWPAPPPVAKLPDDPARAVERETLKVALQQPALVGARFDRLAGEVFTEPAYAAVRAAIGAAGGVGPVGVATAGPSWVARVRDAAPDTTVRGLVTQLAVEPLPTVGDTDDRYAAALLVRLDELAITRQIVATKSRLQRMNPLEAPDYNLVWGELIALEQRKQALREQAIATL